MSSFLFFADLRNIKVREFNPRYAEGEGTLLGQLRHLQRDICGNQEFVEHRRHRVACRTVSDSCRLPPFAGDATISQVICQKERGHSCPLRFSGKPGR